MKKYFIGIKWKNEATPVFHIKDFDNKFNPLDCSLIEKLINYVNMIDSSWNKSNEYIVSVSMNYDGRLVFWDIQTPKGKTNILRRKK